MKKSLAGSLILILFLFLFSSVSFAAVPGEINYQGVLKDGDGVLDGRYTMRFAIYPSPEGDSSSFLWEGIYDGPDRILVENGLYSVRLGSLPGNSIPPAVFNGDTRYLEVGVGGQTLSPRVPLITVPYAYRAVYADTVSYLDGLSAEAFVRLGPASTQETSAEYGVNVKTTHSYGTGVRGEGTSYGGIFKANGIGVAGEGSLIGGSFNSDLGAAVYGTGTLAGGVFTASNGVGVSASSDGAGVSASSEKDHGVYGTTNAANKAGVYGETTSDKKNIAGVYGKSSQDIVGGVYGYNEHTGPGVKGESASGYGVQGVGKGSGPAVYAENTGTGIGVWGKSKDYIGIWGVSEGTHNNDHSVMGGFLISKYPSGVPTSRNYGGLFEGLGVFGDAYISGESYAKKHQNVSPSDLDLAEWVKVNDPSIEKCDVVVLDKNIDKSVARSSAAYSTLVAGIVSTSPAFIAGLHGEGDNVLSDEEMEAKGYRMLALAGQVPCKVSTENGPIERGDLLTTSNTPGYAMKATDPKIGTILGKAMEPLAAGKGKIMVLVTLQ